MAHGYHTKLPHKNGYPGDGYYYVLCDVCGIKIRAKDAVLITDKYNYQHNLLVCRKDADQTNPQDQIRAVRERQIDDPKYIRSEGQDRFINLPTPIGGSEQLLLENGDELITEGGDTVETESGSGPVYS